MAVRGGSRRENQTTLETYEKHADSSIRRMAGTHAPPSAAHTVP